MEETILTAKDLKFRYDPEQPDYALNGVSAEVKRGEFVAVLGANGCGKSTLAKHFNAILLPESGTVLVEGMDTRDEDKIYDIRQTVGMVSRARTTRSLPPWWRKMLPLRWKIWACRRRRCAAAWMKR